MTRIRPGKGAGGVDTLPLPGSRPRWPRRSPSCGSMKQSHSGASPEVRGVWPDPPTLTLAPHAHRCLPSGTRPMSTSTPWANTWISGWSSSVPSGSLIWGWATTTGSESPHPKPPSAPPGLSSVGSPRFRLAGAQEGRAEPWCRLTPVTCLTTGDHQARLLCLSTPSRLTQLRRGFLWLLQTLWTLPAALGYITGRAGVK